MLCKHIVIDLISGRSLKRNLRYAFQALSSEYQREYIK